MEPKELYLNIGRAIPAAEESQMFGKPCFKIGGKAFITFFRDEMVFKLTGDDHRFALGLTDAKLFDPSGKGRAMKEWVQVPFLHQEYWQKLAESAHEFVRT